VTKEVFLEVSTWTHKSPLTKRKHQINTYLKDIISTVTDSDELYILALRLNKVRTKINAEKSAIASKLKSVETSDSMTSNHSESKEILRSKISLL
jgi:hypothetical protein